MRQNFTIQSVWRLYHKADPAFPLPPEILIPAEGVVAEVPGTVHTDLMKAGIIEDPFFADNETKVSWIDEQEWIYKTTFEISGEVDKSNPMELVFDGLDTVAEIRLNGKFLGKVKNMFRQYRYNVQSLMKQFNDLEIWFYPARRFGRENATPIQQFPSARHPERVFVRKSQYSFGWDWGPALPTAGIWKKIYLEQIDLCRISHISFTTLELEKNTAKIEISAAISGYRQFKGRLFIRMNDGENDFQGVIQVESVKLYVWIYKIPNPRLWWPVGEGEPYLYNLTLSLVDDQGQVIDQIEEKVGIRIVRLITESGGRPCFRFEINGRPVFLKGANWIPADSFLPRIDEQKYRDLLNGAYSAHMNVLRVWGGGIYESDVFYSICDELGLLVWQDFMFACAAYPDDDNFTAEVEEELRDNIWRLQFHPSILIWCGNNENEWIWYRDHCGHLNKMPGFRLFHEVFPSLLQQLDPSRPYWPSSPFGDHEDPNNPQTGNRHVWDIWSCWKDYSEVVEDCSHFVTEFGFQGPANPATLRTALPEDGYKVQHRLFEFHNKQDGGPERLFRFLSAHLPVKTDPDDFVYLTQLNQGLALKTCLEHWRLRWPETAGSIIWQLNDCWPVTSWSLIDSQLQPKLAWYFVKHAFAPQLIAFRQNENGQECTLDNQSSGKFSGSVKIFRINGKAGSVSQVHSFAVQVAPKAKKIVFAHLADSTGDEDDIILYAELSGKNEKVISCNHYSSTLLKHLRLAPAKLKVETSQNEGEVVIHLSADKPALFVTLYHPALTFSENGFILLPGFEKVLIGKKKGDATISESDIQEFQLNRLM